MTSQPSIGSFLASLEGTGLETGLNVDHVRAIDEYWAQMRLLYSCFEADLKGPDSEVYVHEIPGGQLTNLKFQATQLGLGTQWLGISFTTVANIQKPRRRTYKLTGFWGILSKSLLLPK
jgi:pyruvate carboxylase